ncbi:MAG: hypothetical protein WA196_05310, partial [Pseudolabrys sp.]
NSSRQKTPVGRELTVLNRRAACISRHIGAAHTKIELLTKQGNTCVVVRLWDRRQVRMNVGEVVVRQDMFAVGRHRAVGRAHEC